MGSAIVPLNRALPSSCRLSIGTIQLSNGLATICNENFDCGSEPQISTSCGNWVPLCKTVLRGTTWVSLPNGISFRPVALAGSRSVTGGQIEHATVTSVVVDGIAECILFHGHTRTAYIYHCVWSSTTGRLLHGCTQAWPNQHSVGYPKIACDRWNKCVKQLSGVG